MPSAAFGLKVVELKQSLHCHGLLKIFCRFSKYRVFGRNVNKMTFNLKSPHVKSIQALRGFSGE